MGSARAPRETGSLVVALLIIAVGIGWLLNAHQVGTGVNWIWVLAPGVLGALMLVLGGLDKLTVVVGPFLIALAVVSFLRQTGGIVAGTEVPFLLVVFGILLVVARFVPWNQD
jgi:hypothetical protein